MRSTERVEKRGTKCYKIAENTEEKENKGVWESVKEYNFKLDRPCIIALVFSTLTVFILLFMLFSENKWTQLSFLITQLEGKGSDEGNNSSTTSSSNPITAHMAIGFQCCIFIMIPMYINMLSIIRNQLTSIPPDKTKLYGREVVGSSLIEENYLNYPRPITLPQQIFTLFHKRKKPSLDTFTAFTLMNAIEQERMQRELQIEKEIFRYKLINPFTHESNYIASSLNSDESKPWNQNQNNNQTSKRKERKRKKRGGNNNNNMNNHINLQDHINANSRKSGIKINSSKIGILNKILVQRSDSVASNSTLESTTYSQQSRKDSDSSNPTSLGQPKYVHEIGIKANYDCLNANSYYPKKEKISSSQVNYMHEFTNYEHFRIGRNSNIQNSAPVDITQFRENIKRKEIIEKKGQKHRIIKEVLLRDILQSFLFVANIFIIIGEPTDAQNDRKAMFVIVYCLLFTINKGSYLMVFYIVQTHKVRFTISCLVIISFVFNWIFVILNSYIFLTLIIK